MASLKLTEQIITDLLCCSKCFSKGIRTIRKSHGFLAYDIVHAVEFSRIGRTSHQPHDQPTGQLHNPTILTETVKSTLTIPRNGGFNRTPHEGLLSRRKTCERRWDCVPLEAGQLFRLPHLWGDELEDYVHVSGAANHACTPGVICGT